MATIHSVLLMNSTAVAAYEAGENECAATSLIEALRLLPTAFAKSNTSHNDLRQNEVVRQTSDTRRPDVYNKAASVNHGACRKQVIKFCDLSSYSVHPTCTHSQDTMNSQTTMGDRYESMYDGAFLIDASTGIKPKEATAVLLYNLALVMHNEGISRNRSSALDRALSFYRQALAFLATETKSFSSAIIYVVMAAIQTNMSHIMNELFLSDQNTNEATVDRLVHLIMRMECDPTIRQSDIEFFQRAVTFISLTYLHFAPAA